MRRSFINRILEESIAFLSAIAFRLPPFAFWSPAQWYRRRAECQPIFEQQLGWDVTDFGRGDFERWGLVLFTLRNGVLRRKGPPRERPYAEKIMIVREGQYTPTHFHFQKTEDIINRGGGHLLMRVWNATRDEQLSDREVVLLRDGIRIRTRAGGVIRLKPGESVCLPPWVYHEFWADRSRGTVLAGEVSSVNDDRRDNRFLERLGRFPAVEEDESPQYLLCIDYRRYLLRSRRARF